MIQSDEKWLFNGQIKNKKKYHLKRAGWLFGDSLERCLVSPSSVLMHTSLFKKVGFFREDFDACEDYDYSLNLHVGYNLISTYALPVDSNFDFILNNEVNPDDYIYMIIIYKYIIYKYDHNL